MRRIFFILLVIFNSLSLFSQNAYQEKRVPKKIKIICDSLMKSSKIESQYIGIAGWESENWPFYLKLKKKANTKVLIELTNHPSPIIRSYSFFALLDQKSPKILETIKKNENDTIQIKFQSGCIVSRQFLIDLVVNRYYNHVIENKNAKKEDLEYLKAMQQKAMDRFGRSLNK